MELEQVRAELDEILARLQVSENKLDDLTEQQPNEQRALPRDNAPVYDDVTAQITNGNDIQLDSYKSIPEFDGDKHKYRSWRNQVSRRMHMIEPFKNIHPKYEAALGIIRAKIVGPASDVLTNNKTAYNINAILDRLDMTYADQRPLYIVEAEMTAIKQMNKTLQEFFDAMNQALNLVISKITLTYANADEQKSLVEEAQRKAIRTFIIGLKSQTTRNILYAHQPKTLSEAFTMAQTVFYDNQYLHLDQNREGRNPPRATQIPSFPRKPFPYAQQQFQNAQNKFNVNMQCKQSPPMQKKPEPMEIDPSSRVNQNINYRRPRNDNVQPSNEPQKREHESSQQYMPRKFQRINQLVDSESDPNKEYEGDICGEIPDDLISNKSDDTDTDSSAFLCE